MDAVLGLVVFVGGEVEWMLEVENVARRILSTKERLATFSTSNKYSTWNTIR